MHNAYPVAIPDLNHPKRNLGWYGYCDTCEKRIGAERDNKILAEWDASRHIKSEQ